MAEGLLLGRDAVGPAVAIGGLPLNRALYLQLLWCPVAVRVVSLLLESVFPSIIYFCVSVFLCRM